MNAIDAKTLTQDSRAATGSRPAIWFRTTAGPSIGFGHLRRVLILAQMLEYAAEPHFLVDPEDDSTPCQAKARGWNCSEFRPDRLWREAPLPAVIVIDTREARGLAVMIDRARDRGIPVASIHDLGLNLVPSDVLIDGSVSPGVEGRAPESCCAGSAYQVLAPGFAHVQGATRLMRPAVENVFVNLGGGDSSRFFSRVLEGLRLCGRPFGVTGARGFARWGQDDLLERDWTPLRFRWARPEESFVDLYRGADLAVTAGGLSVYEALCAGTPALALSYDALQQRTVTALAAGGLCVDLGAGEALEPRRMEQLVSSLAGDPARRQRMCDAGRRMVDGRGAERVSRIILALIEKRHWNGLGSSGRGNARD